MGKSMFEIAPEYKFTPNLNNTGLVAIGNFDCLPPQTLNIDCETIILKKRDLDISFKLEAAKMENFDKLIINGITFVREKTDE